MAEGIGTQVIGQNPLWKQATNMGRRTSQHFVSVPHARFIVMLTSTEPPRFNGRRVKRDQYRAAGERHLNADVNGAYDSIRKVAPKACARGSSGCVVHPMRLGALTSRCFARDGDLCSALQNGRGGACTSVR